MAILKGFAVLAKMGTLQEGSIKSTNSSLNLSAETEESTTKDDAVGGVLYPVQTVKYITAELSCEGKQTSDADILGSVNVGDSLACEFVTGKRKYSFTGLVKSLNYTGDMNSDATYSLSISSTGAVTMSAVS